MNSVLGNLKYAFMCRLTTSKHIEITKLFQKFITSLF